MNTGFVVLVAICQLLTGSNLSSRFDKATGSTVDVTQHSRAFEQALSAEAASQTNLEFLNDDQIIVASVDDIDMPVFAAKDNRPLRRMHLSLDFFSLQGEQLKYSGQLQFDTETSNVGVRALPSGHFLVTAQRKILLFDSNRNLVAEKSVEDVCGLHDPLPRGFLYDDGLYVASGRVAVLKLSNDKLVQHPLFPLFQNKLPGGADTRYCWFSTTDLKPIAAVHSELYTGTVSARGMTLYVQQLQRNRTISPDGVSEFSYDYPANCVRDRLTHEGPPIYFLRAENATAFSCDKGRLSIEQGGKISNISTGQKNSFAQVKTDAWRFPVLAIAYETIHSESSGFRVNNRVEVVNYKSGASVVFPESTTFWPRLYAPGIYKVAISPDGRHVATLARSVLSVFPVPESLISK